MIDTPINVTLPATGETPAAITLATGCTGWKIQARGTVDMLISDLAAMTTYFTVKAGTDLAVDQVLSPGSTVLYAVSGTVADTVELIKTRL
jgi:hypothetical protein